MQRIVREYPPLYDEIAAAFDLEGKLSYVRPIFSWGSEIYNPHGVAIPPCLVAHEAVHGIRQRENVSAWWRRYIDDSEFRLQEEVLAHVAEYRSRAVGKPRNERRWLMVETAKRLAAPLYCYDPPVSAQNARIALQALLKAVEHAAA